MILETFVNFHGISLDRCDAIPYNPNLVGDVTWASRHYICVLRRGESRLTVFLSTTATAREPVTVTRVLDAVATIAVHHTLYPTYALWSRDLRYKAEEGRETFEKIEHEANRLREFLGPVLFHELCTEVVL